MNWRGPATLAVFMAAAVLHTWPLATDLAGLSRLDNADTALNTWIVAWVAHALPRGPLDLFDAPMFYPEARTLAYSEHLFVPALLGAPLLWAGVGAVTTYNLLALAGLALSGWTMCLVMTGWTGSLSAGVVSGLLYAFNAHLLTRLPHLQALHLEFLPITLYAVDRILAASAAPFDTWPRRRRRIARLVAAFVAQALCSNYTLVFLAAALAAMAAARLSEWQPVGRRRALVDLAIAGGVAAVVLAPFLWPYYVVRQEMGLARSIDEVRVFSAGWLDYLTTAGRLHYDLWSHRWFEGRTALFPGIAATALAVGALARSEAWRDPRVRMTVAAGALGLALSFGPALPGYAWLHTHVPLLQGIRGAARWGLLPLVAVAILAGFQVAALERRWGRSPYWSAVVLLLIGVVTIEALRAPMGFVPTPAIPAVYDTIARGDGAVVELPLYGGRQVSGNARYLVPATRHFRPLVNGYSGFESAAARERAERWQGFPAAEILDEMRAIGVTRIVVHVADIPAPQSEAAAVDPRLALEADDGERRLYRLLR